MYPVGTCVILDSYDIALVHAANSDVTQIHRPVVRVVLSSTGQLLDPGPLVDLAEVGADGNFVRSIIKVTDPAKWGITPGDYFV